MPKFTEVPVPLQPFLDLGVKLTWEGLIQAHGNCPLCDREGKFFVETSTGKWDCKKCMAIGNTITFLRDFYNCCSSIGLEELVIDRKLLSVETLRKWGVVNSCLTGDWLVPGHGAGGKLDQLYHYEYSTNSKKKVLKATWGLPHALFGMLTYNGDYEMVFLCEGPWDGMALWEVLQLTDWYVNHSCVLAIPGASVWQDYWNGLFGDKIVNLMCQSDHPRTNKKTGKVSPPVSLTGMRKVAKTLSSCPTPPKEINYLKWGEEGYLPEEKSGYDIRDYLTV